MLDIRFLALIPFATLAAPACTTDDGDDTGVSTAPTGVDTGHADHGDHSGESTADTSSGEATSSSAGSSEDTGTEATGAPTADTWENWALPSFFEVYCNECHPSGSSSRDFSDYDQVGTNVEHIRCGVAPEVIAGCDGHIEPGHLPIGDGPFPSDEERWRLVDWIDAGMPRD